MRKKNYKGRVVKRYLPKCNDGFQRTDSRSNMLIEKNNREGCRTFGNQELWVVREIII